MAERIIGVDFGTSTSVIRVKRYGDDGQPIGERIEAKEVIFSGKGGMVPTLILKKNSDPNVVYYGHEAELGRRGHTLYHDFKVNLENSDPEIRKQARALTEEFYAYMARQYRMQSEGGFFGSPTDRERTIISYPVKWSDKTKRFMLEIAAKAGFPNVEGMDEAQAAIHAVLVQNEAHLKANGLLQDGTPATILLIDMGAGTTDLVLCRYTPGSGDMEMLNTWPQGDKALFGGKEVDGLLQNFFRPMLCQEEAEGLFRRVGSDKFKEWKDKLVSPTLLRNETVTSFDALDTCLDLMGVEMDEYSLDRAAFEKCLGDYLPELPTLIRDCVKHSSLEEKDIDMVIVTGGHSQWYFVREMLLGNMKRFGDLELARIQSKPERIIALARPQETVALGLAFQRIPIRVQPKEMPVDEKDSDKKREAETKPQSLHSNKEQIKPQMPAEFHQVYSEKAKIGESTDNTFPLKYDPRSRLRPVIDVYSSRNGNSFIAYCSAVKRDGIVLLNSSWPEDVKREVYRWDNIVSSIIPDPDPASKDKLLPPAFIIGLRKDGKIVTAGGLSKTSSSVIERWTDIVSICANPYYVVGLTQNGSIFVESIISSEISNEITFSLNQSLKKCGFSLAFISLGKQSPYTVIWGITKEGTLVKNCLSPQNNDSWEQINPVSGDITFDGEAIQIVPNVDDYDNTHILCRNGHVYEFNGKAISEDADLFGSSILYKSGLGSYGIKADGTIVMSSVYKACEPIWEKMRTWRRLLASAVDIRVCMGLKMDGSIYCSSAGYWDEKKVLWMNVPVFVSAADIAEVESWNLFQ